MLKRYATVLLAGAGWGAVVLDAVGMFSASYTMAVGRIAFGVAVLASVQLMLWAHVRPIGQAYEFGYEMGMKDQLRAMNTRPVAPIRRNPHGLFEFNRKSLNGHRSRVDA